MNDRFGCPISFSSDASIAEWNDFMLSFLTHSASVPKHLKTLSDNEPDSALLAATKGLIFLTLGRSELSQAASDTLLTAERLQTVRPISPREKAYIESLRCYVEGFPRRAADKLDSMLVQFPQDAFGHKMVHALRFISGDQIGMLNSLKKVIHLYQGDHIASGYINGCYAFALEETGDFQSAEFAGRRAVEMSSDDAWGTHAVAHVLDMTSRSREGADWLSTREKSWDHCANFGFHLWWHLALFHLDRGNIDGVFDLYDRYIRRETTDDFRDISNGASLLLRLELEGIPVGNRWEEMANICEKRIDDACNVFADLHYMLALIGGDRRRTADNLLRRMRHTGKKSKTDIETVTAETGLPTASGLQAFRDGNYRRAANEIFLGLPALKDIGGSHAQRDIFERMGIESAIRAGAYDMATFLLDDRSKRRNYSNDRYSRSRYSQIKALSQSAEPARTAGMAIQF